MSSRKPRWAHVLHGVIDHGRESVGAPATLTERMKAEREQVIKVVRRIEAKEGKH
jgi:hypothetical protein